MAVCTVEFSPEVAYAGAGFYFWQKFATPFGVAFLISVTILFAFAIAASFYGLSALYVWVVLGVVLANVAFQTLSHFRDAPLLAKRIAALEHRTAQIETSEAGIRISFNQDAGLIDWKRYGRIWLRDNFVVIAGCLVLPARGMTPDLLKDLETYGRAKR